MFKGRQGGETRVRKSVSGVVIEPEFRVDLYGPRTGRVFDWMYRLRDASGRASDARTTAQPAQKSRLGRKTATRI